MTTGFDRVDYPEEHVIKIDEAQRLLQLHEPDETVTWLGHAAFLLRMGGKTILIDPYLSDTAGPGPFGPRRFAPPGLPVDRLPAIDLLLISHSHYDHLDAATIERIPNKATVEVVVPLGLGNFFHRRGFTNVSEIDWFDALSHGDLRVQALPAIHWSKRALENENSSLWCSYAIQSAAYKLYFSGDTSYGPAFKTLGEDQGPFDLALIGIGAYEPRSIMHASHATPEEAVRIARDIGSRNILGMHWGTIVLSDEPPFEPPERFHTAALDAGFTANQIWRLAIGETRPLPANRI